MTGVDNEGGGASDDGNWADASDADKRAFLRAIAEEIRAADPESDQIAAMLYRVSDVYDPDEDTDPRDVYVNMKNILRVKEQGGKPDPEGA